MKLRARILIITFLILLFVQGLNCILEIGFLASNLEENNLRRYQIIGRQIQRKLNVSLIFGKPLVHLNYDKLLAHIIPVDIENLHVIDRQGRLVYSKNTNQERGDTGDLALEFKLEKTTRSWDMYFPISDRNHVQGNIILEVSYRAARDQLFDLTRQSVVNFVMILGISLPLLYWLLTFFIDRPYKRLVKDLDTWLARGETKRLLENGIDLSPLSDAEKRLKEIRKTPLVSRNACTRVDDGRSGHGLEQEMARIMNTD